MVDYHHKLNRLAGLLLLVYQAQCVFQKYSVVLSTPQLHQRIGRI